METTIHKSSEHILLTSLGTVLRDEPTKYKLETKETEAFLTPLALVDLLEVEQRPNRVIAVITQGAKATTWKTFQEGICQTLGLVPEVVVIPNGSSSDEIRKILESVAECIPESADLTLDVTQGLRHFPFIFYALVLYLTSLRGVKIRGAYYGMVEGLPPDVPRPIIDLRPLLELPEWFHAVRMFRDQGTTKPMADRLQPLADRLNDEKRQLFGSVEKEAGKALAAQASQVQRSVEGLQKYAFAYESALPLELEKASRDLIDSIKGLPKVGGSVNLPPLIGDLTRAIVSAVEESAFSKPPSGRGTGNPKSL